MNNALQEAMPQEAVNLEPLTRFKFRMVSLLGNCLYTKAIWKVECGHNSSNEHVGFGDTLEAAIFDAGIDTEAGRPTFTD